MSPVMSEPSEKIVLLTKEEVVARLKISERSLEKLVRSRRFPEPLRIGKRVQWVESVVERWLGLVVAKQVDWEPPKRVRRTD